jgi:hypothetical protein
VNPVPSSRRDRRILVFGFMTVMPLLVIARGFPAWRRWDLASRESAAARLQQAAHARTIIGRARVTHDSLAARQQRFMTLAPLLLRGDTPAMAAAALVSLISTTAMGSSVRLGPVQVRPDTSTRGVFSRVAVHAEITGDVRGVSAFLSTLEQGPTLLAVRELTISQMEPGGAPERAEALHVQLVAEALMLTTRHRNAPKSRKSGVTKP